MLCKNVNCLLSAVKLIHFGASLVGVLLADRFVLQVFKVYHLLQVESKVLDGEI